MISVCIATHNGGKYIKTQLESILPQLNMNDEVIISDDGSTDDTLEVINSFGDSRIKIVRYIQPNKCGHNHIYVSRNFENALKQSKGDFIFLSDQDDIWVENKVNSYLKYFSEGYNLIASDLAFMINGIKDLDNCPWRGKSPVNNWLIKKPEYYGCTMAFDRKVLNWALPFPSQLPLHDNWIGLLADALGRVKYISTPMIFYRIHDNATSHIDNTLLYKIMYRLRFYCQIMCRITKIRLHL